VANLGQRNSEAPTMRVKSIRRRRAQRKKASASERKPLSVRNLEILQAYPHLPPTSTIPVPVAGLIRGTSEKTIRRRYPLVAVSDGRVGVRKGDLEADRAPVPFGADRAKTSDAI
jgi:hypothetical protein